LSNSQRAKERRRKRSNLNKSQRDQLSKQHFGDKYHVKGHGPLRKDETKEEVLEQRRNPLIPGMFT
jgi:hypothetical protein